MISKATAENLEKPTLGTILFLQPVCFYNKRIHSSCSHHFDHYFHKLCQGASIAFPFMSDQVSIYYFNLLKQICDLIFYGS